MRTDSRQEEQQRPRGALPSWTSTKFTYISQSVLAGRPPRIVNMWGGSGLGLGGLRANVSESVGLGGRFI